MNKNSYTHVFWDWNGTIIDDLKINFSIINTLLSNRKKDTISPLRYRQAFTFPIKDFYGRIGLPIYGEEYEKLVRDYWTLYKSKTKDIPLMAGVLEVMNMLGKNQIKQYVLSASDKKMVFDQMSVYGIRSFQEHIHLAERLHLRIILEFHIRTFDQKPFFCRKRIIRTV